MFVNRRNLAEDFNRKVINLEKKYNKIIVFTYVQEDFFAEVYDQNNILSAYKVFLGFRETPIEKKLKRLQVALRARA